MRMIGILSLLCFWLAGCAELIIHDSDTVPETTGKVIARAVLILPTFLMSEVLINDAEQEEQALAIQAPYFSQECVKAGYAVGTSEHNGCMSVKQAQIVASPNRGVVVGMPGIAARPATTCHAGYSGRWMNCW